MERTDRQILRDLTRRYVDLCADPIQDQRRDAWRRHNSLEWVRPLIYVRAFAWDEMPESRCICRDSFYHPYETWLRQALFRDRFRDDWVFEPWITVDAARITPPDGVWGVPHRWIGREGRGAGVWRAPIQQPGDLGRLVATHHRIDETATAERLARIQDAIGDLIPVVVDRGPAYRMWDADISTQLAYLRGLEQIMWDMLDRPAWLHELLAFMRDGILTAQREAEEAGDWRLLDHLNQSIPYALELDDPSPDARPVCRRDLWVFCASQETTGVGPAMFDEFMLQYQIPIMAEFGLAAYGCCEDLTHKIDLLRQIPNLRRIAVAPAANVASCAEQIGEDYVLSYRPSPADMVAYGLPDDDVAGLLRDDLSACRGSHVDITLKDVETVQHDPQRIVHWVEIVRRVVDELWDAS